MPPHGLYTFPRHHLYGGRVRRPVYSTASFISGPGSSPVVPESDDGHSHGHNNGHGRYGGQGQGQGQTTADIAGASASASASASREAQTRSSISPIRNTSNDAFKTPTPGSSKTKSKSKGKKEKRKANREDRKKRQSSFLTSSPTTPSKKRKRNRESSIYAAAPESQYQTPSDDRRGAPTPDDRVSAPSTSKKATGRKNSSDIGVTTSREDKRADKKQKQAQTQTQKPEKKKRRASEAKTKHSRNGRPADDHAGDRSDGHHDDDSEENEESDDPSLGLTATTPSVTAALPPYGLARVPQKTPVPLPLPLPRIAHMTDAACVDPSRIAARTRGRQGWSRITESSMGETTPSSTLDTAAAHYAVDTSRSALDIPPGRGVTDSHDTPGRKQSKKARLVVALTPTKSCNGGRVHDHHSWASTPNALTVTKRHHLGKADSASASGKTTNVIHLNTPARGSSKLPGSARSFSAATSVGTSFLSSDSEAETVHGDLIRTGKPYTRSGADVDPFFMPSSIEKRRKDKNRSETHEEDDVTEFSQKYAVLQHAVNFTTERGHLHRYLQWIKDNSEAVPMTCLGRATGCSKKQEELLRLLKEKNLHVLHDLDVTNGDQATLMKAQQRSCEAENFLIMATTSRVPVPIGPLEGVWTLYSPTYSEYHFDRYGFGQRKLSIHSMADGTNAFTARLNIPPRPTAYCIHAFTTPPHASFRTTTIKTVSEGYQMDIVFMGNGYLQLRVDLSLLLRGKPSEMEGGKAAAFMEFVGIHQNAQHWAEYANDELEEEGRKLFAKYDGGVGYD